MQLAAVLGPLDPASHLARALLVLTEQLLVRPVDSPNRFVLALRAADEASELDQGWERRTSRGGGGGGGNRRGGRGFKDDEDGEDE